MLSLFRLETVWNKPQIPLFKQGRGIVWNKPQIPLFILICNLGFSYCASAYCRERYALVQLEKFWLQVGIKQGCDTVWNPI